MQMNSQADVRLANLLLNMVEHLTIGYRIAPCAGNTHQQIYANPLCVGIGTIHCSYIFHIYRADSIADDVCC